MGHSVFLLLGDDFFALVKLVLFCWFIGVFAISGLPLMVDSGTVVRLATVLPLVASSAWLAVYRRLLVAELPLVWHVLQFGKTALASCLAVKANAVLRVSQDVPAVRVRRV